MKHALRLSLFVVASALILSSCQEASGPIGGTMPQGEWTRTTPMPNGKEHRSTMFLHRDSVFVADTVVSFVNGNAVIDSIHSIEMELTVAGDGYFRAVEQHTEGRSDITSQELRYWYFYTQDDSLYFYRGMRLRGGYLSLPGDWNLSAADSAFLGESYTYSFTEDKVTISRLAPTGVESHIYPYHASRDSLTIVGDTLPFSGDRFEIVPGLALYITSHREAGYAPRK